MPSQVAPFNLILIEMIIIIYQINTRDMFKVEKVDVHGKPL